MPSPVEFRFYMLRFTMEHLRNGLQPLKANIGPAVNGQAPSELFAPPSLQMRYKERVIVNGQPALEWTEWVDVPVIREGADLGALPPPAAA